MTPVVKKVNVLVKLINNRHDMSLSQGPCSIKVLFMVVIKSIVSVVLFPILLLLIFLPYHLLLFWNQKPNPEGEVRPGKDS